MRRSTGLSFALALVLALAAGCGGSSSSSATRDTDGGDPVDAAGDVAAPDTAATDAADDTGPAACVEDADCADRFADLGACERAVCDEGACVRAAAPNFVACDDGDPCTVVSFCEAGTCKGGLPRACDDGDDCTRDACDAAAGGCVHDALDGVGCDDGDPCTRNDRCVAGACGGTFDEVCGCDDDGDCVVREDGDRCNGTLHCVAGQCVVDPATVVVCDTTGDPLCRPTRCDPDSGACAPTPAPDGTRCEDGNLCTRGDTCQDGVCEGGAYGCGACDGDAFCAAHDDGDACNGTLACVEEECRTDADSVIRCDGAAGEPCAASWCDPAAGACVTADRADGAWCDDADPCTRLDRCGGGACGGVAVDCDDGDPCTEDTCAAPDGCAHVPAAGPGCATPCDDFGDCDDGDPCTEDVCEASGTCSHSTIPDCGCEADADCDDGDPCTADTCDDAANTCRNEPLDDGAVCAPAVDACHTGSVCDGGACVTGAAVVCDDDVDCTTDSCDAATGCVFTPTEACTCETDEDCDDGSPCTVDTCDTESLTCAFAPAGAGIACSDGSVCTDGDECDAAGACVPGPALDCGDGDPCTQDLCDAVQGCQHPDAPAGTPCDDGDPCTGPDTCDAGDCSPGALRCELACGDGVDDDGDGDTDCDDDDCAAAPACQTEGDCRDGVDGDGDGDTDCDDDDCAAVPCGPPESACADGVDDDNDGDTDCDDADCAAAAPCNPEGDCRDGIDEDLDGDTDCDDTDCVAAPACNPEGGCRDGVDDDFDGDTDCDDADCVGDAYCQPEADCENGIDDDFHGDTDCADPDCEGELACVNLCPAPIPIACDELVDGSNVGVESLVLDGGCAIGGGSRGWPGGEVTYVFAATQDYAEVTVRVAFEGGGDHDLFVLDEGCDPRSCVTAGVVDVTFPAETGDVRYVVVDGHAIAPEGAFGLSVECVARADSETDCADGVDEDLDGATDCEDEDCEETVDCAGATCAAAETVACGDSVTGTTVDGPDRIDLYPAPCSAISAGAPERAYAYTAAEDGTVRARVAGDGVDLDIYVLEGTCAADACVADATLVGTDVVQWNATAGTTYYLVVDGTPGEAGPFTLDVACGCDDDGYEDNDGEGAAAALAPGTYDGLQLCPGEHDWYAFEACAGASVTIDVAFADAEGNIDGGVYGPDGGAALDEAYGSGDDLQLSFTAVDTGTHLLDLLLNPDRGFLFGNAYDLAIAVDTSTCAAPSLCDVTRPLACGDTLSGVTVGVDSLEDGYGCSGWLETGGEIVYEFVAPRSVDGATVSVAATTGGFDPDLFVLGGGCDPEFCVDYGDSAATFDAPAAGATFYVVVDGANGTAGGFDLTLDCPAPDEDCDNGLDDDTDGDTDCDDTDCADAPNCVQTCASGFPLDCDDTDPWTTVAAPSAIDAYLGCGGKDASGPDYVYDVTPATDAQVTVTLVSNTGGVDLDLYVLAGDCRANACVAAGIADDDAGEIVTFDAVGGTTYYLAVDGAAGQAGDYDILVECGEAQTLCAGAAPIVCGDTLDGDTTGAPQREQSYGCSFWTETGGEAVYAFTPTEDLTGVTLTLVEDSVDHDLYQLGAACDPQQCESGDSTLSFDATAGETYYLVVEGYQGDEGTYAVALTCPTATEICDDDRDNDGDGATDCDDTECDGAEGCADCAPYPIECGFGETYTTVGLADAVSDYACGGATNGGPDAQYSIQLAEARAVTLTLTPTPAGAPLDLYVLEAACDGGACVASSATAGVEELTFVAAAGVTYYVVVDGPAGAGAAYEFAATCGPASAALCAAPTPIACGDSLAGDNGGLVSVVDTYGCASRDETGGEVVYAFTPPRDITGVTATPSGATFDADVFVLDATCDAAGACLAHGDEAATFDALAGETYHIVVDGFVDDPAGAFTLDLACPAAPTNETDCANGLDEDDDDAADCEDVDCETDAACNGGCAAPTPIACDQSVLGDTTGRLGALNGYESFNCGPFENDQSGGETVYVFSPAETVTAQLAVAATGWEARVLVLAGSCDPASCAAYYEGSGQFLFTGGASYYVVVDGYQGGAGPYGLTITCP